MAVFTVVIAVVTSAYAVFSRHQWLAMREQGRIMDRMARSAEGTAKATQDAAEAARRNTETLVSLESPNLFVQEINLRGAGSNVGSLRVGAYARCVLINYGRTPAILLSYGLECLIIDALPPTPVWTNVVHLPFEHAIHTDQWYLLEMPLDVLASDDQVNSVVTGESILWLYGYVVFGGLLHETWRRGFCYRWTERDPQGHRGFRPVDPPTYSYYKKE